MAEKKSITLKTLRTQRRRFVDGAWVGENIHGLPGLWFRVKGWRNPEAAALIARLAKDVPDDEREDGQPNAAAWTRIENEMIAEAILTDWRGVREDDGEPDLPCDGETVRQLLAEPELAFLKTAIIASAQNVAEAGRETIEAETKNSLEPSAGA